MPHGLDQVSSPGFPEDLRSSLGGVKKFPAVPTVLSLLCSNALVAPCAVWIGTDSHASTEFLSPVSLFLNNTLLPVFNSL